MPDIIPISAFKDNYIWMLREQRHAVAVDPGDAAPVRAWLEANQVGLVAILCTHHHNDHTGGICELAEVYNAPVYGPRQETIPCLSHAVDDGDSIEIAQLGIALQVLGVPGHTGGHVAYLQDGNLFCGDTLFGCGCGRLFEGTPAQLHKSLQRLAQLPEQTRVYCAHEYTEANLLFALACEPENEQTKLRQAEARRQRSAGLPTLPSTVALEKATNPFLRCSETEIRHSLERHFGIKLAPDDELATFTALRNWKNNF